MKKQAGRFILFALVLLLAFGLTACSKKEAVKAQEAEVGFKPRLDTTTKCSITVVGHYNNFEALVAEFNLFNQYYPNVEIS